MLSSISWVEWINYKEYPPLELFLFLGGCFLWVFAYVIYIKDIVKYKYLEMPIFAGCANIGWEFTWSFLAKTDMGLLPQYTYRTWFFCDLFIFGGLLAYGWKQYQTPRLRSYHVPLCLFSAVAWVFGVYSMHTSNLDTPIGATSAYLAQLCISFLYIPLLLRQGTSQRFSFSAGWLRTVGTGMNTVFMHMHYPDNHFLRVIATLSTILDVTYVFLAWKMLRELKGAPQTAGSSAVGEEARSSLATARSPVSQPSPNFPSTSLRS